ALVVAAQGDRVTPEWACRKVYDQLGSAQRTFLSLARGQAFSSDFGHVEMLVSPAAQQEVWPLVRDWLAQVEPRG
ncbi:alpha/beta hydrolase, partial [Pseudomonas sp. CCC2.2]|nr:alpha/beta hydrolase [Pseudomonas sp. CCC2.2]